MVFAQAVQDEPLQASSSGDSGRPIRIQVDTAGSTNALQNAPAPFIVSSQGDDLMLNISLDAADMQLTESDVDRILSDSDEEDQRLVTPLNTGTPRGLTSRLNEGPTTSPSLNPLVTSGIVNAELAGIFYPVEEPVPEGRKRPLRIQSKARVMTNDDVISDILEQQKKLEEKKKLAEERKRKRNEKTGSKGQPSKRKNRRAMTGDDFCCNCAIDYDEYPEHVDEFWVGCSGKVDGTDCTHWCCPRCVPQGFHPVDDTYFCSSCRPN